MLFVRSEKRDRLNILECLYTLLKIFDILLTYFLIIGNGGR